MLKSRRRLFDASCLQYLQWKQSVAGELTPRGGVGLLQASTQSLSNGQNMPYGSMNTGLITTGIPLNQGVNQGMNQGLHSGLSNHNQGLSGLNPSLNYPLNSSLSSIGQLSNPPINGSLNSSLNPQTSLGMGSYGSQLGMSQYGGQPAGHGGQPTYSSMNGVLYGSGANSVASQQVLFGASSISCMMSCGDVLVPLENPCLVYQSSISLMEVVMMVLDTRAGA
jgi:hypothetical protein